MKHAFTVQVRIGRGFRPAPMTITASECRWTFYTPYIGIGTAGEISIEPTIEMVGDGRGRDGKRTPTHSARRRIQLPAAATWLGVEAAADYHGAVGRAMRDVQIRLH